MDKTVLDSNLWGSRRY